MSPAVRASLAVLLAGLWIGASEFFRNQLLLNATWVAHYDAMGLVFPSAPINAGVWVVWGFVYAGVIFAISRRYGLAATTVLGWVVGFLMMWLVTWNLSVLPTAILWFAVPLSLLESFLAALICLKVAPQR
jgi:hypothetical protein